jgi:hypothetical protein
MNEQLQGKLIEILSGIQDATRVAGDFAMEQLPEVARTYVLYGRVQTLVELALSLMLVAAGAVALFVVYRHLKTVDVWDAIPGIVILGFSCGVSSTIIGLISAKSAASSAALVWLAPKVWLLRELAAMVK